MNRNTFLRSLITFLENKDDVSVNDIGLSELTMNFRYYPWNLNFDTIRINFKTIDNPNIISYSIDFEYNNELSRYQNISYLEVKNMISDLLDMNKLFFQNGLPVDFSLFEYKTEPRIKRLEEKRLSYYPRLVQALRNGFYVKGNYLRNMNINIPLNNFVVQNIVRNNNISLNNISKIYIKFNPDIYTIILNDNREYNLTIPDNNMRTIIDELLRNSIYFQNRDLTQIYILDIQGDPTIDRYNRLSNLYIQYINNNIRREPFAGSNPTIKLITNNIGCSTNSKEEENPVDPIDLEIIPENLKVTVVPINYVFPQVLSSTSCFNARNLWLFWEQSANNNPPRPAINPLTNMEFNAESIIYVKNLLDI